MIAEYSDRENPRFNIRRGQEDHLSWRWEWRLLPKFEAEREGLYDAKEELSGVGLDMQRPFTS